MGFLGKLFGRDSERVEPDTMAAGEGTYGVGDTEFRSASVAEIGGPPSGDPFASCYGGHGVALPSETIPEYEGEPMFPFLQVNCAELPYVPEELQGVALFVLWASDKAINAISHEDFGGGIVLREYATLDGLEPVQDVTKPKRLKTAGVKWALVNDAPYRMNSRDNSGNHKCAKIGGYPTTVAYDLSESDAKGTYVFQMPVNMAGYIWTYDFEFAHFLKSGSGQWQWDCQ